jgi:hypothetical protein
LAWRLPAYQGALQAIVLAEERGERARHNDADDVIVLTPEMVQKSPVLTGLDGLIDYSISG